MRFLSCSLACIITLLVAASTHASQQSALQSAVAGRFHIGVAINASQILEKDSTDTALITHHFDSISPENALKWESLHPEVDRYDFELADRYVEFGHSRKMFVLGHTLLWHQQVPASTFVDGSGQRVSKEVLAERLRSHIRTVVGRYKGKIQAWDVANEAIGDDGKLRTDAPWYAILGEDALRIAFATAHEVDPEAELYYNDYSLWNPAKRATVIALLKRLRAEGLRIDAVGLQEHYSMTWPSLEEADAAFSDFVKAGFDVMVTELDMTMLPRPDSYQGAEVSRSTANRPELNPFKEGLPDAQAKAQADRYAAFFTLYKKYVPHLKRVTLWGLRDGSSWLNGWPIRGRTDHPVLFDRAGKPKPAFSEICAALSKN